MTVEPATFRDGDTYPRAPERSYVQCVLFVRGASRGRFEAEQDAAPARMVRNHVAREAGVSVRANYVALPSVAGRGQARTRRKPPDRGVKALVLSRKNAPLAQNRRNGAPQGDALPEDHRLARGAGSETRQGAPRGAPCPSLLKGRERGRPRARLRARPKLTSRDDARERLCVAV